MEGSRKLESVRVHVERVIGLVRNKYTILRGILPLDYLMKVDEMKLSTIDKVTVVCTALTNVCDSYPHWRNICEVKSYIGRRQTAFFKATHLKTNWLIASQRI